MSKQYILGSIAFVAMLGVVGCSNSDKTTAPVGDTVPPTVVEQLTGVVVEGANSMVQLNWKAGPELDLVGYHIYRSVNGGASKLVGTVLQPRWKEYSLAGADYVYEVAAFDDANPPNVGPRTSTSILHVDDSASAHGNNLN